MSYPSGFLTLRNFELAFLRLRTGQNQSYRAFFRHLLPSYALSLRANLRDLIDDLRTDRYSPDAASVVYQPKASGVLRPITLLTMRDMVLYQALTNVIADAFHPVQQRFARTRSFGSLYAGPGSSFFFRSWKRSYREYMHALERAYKSGRTIVAEFDLVSFYDLIDHNLLRTALAPRITHPGLLHLLEKCLAKWTNQGSVRHGVPQGPEPSAFLAECILFALDQATYPSVTYLRYVDDIRLLGTDIAPLRRALLRLDLASKALGLVPQAQKIEIRRVTRLADLQRTVPSAVLQGVDPATKPAGARARLIGLLRRSLRGRGQGVRIGDITAFKYSLLRLSRRRDVLRRIAPLLSSRPDVSWVLAAYLKKFPHDRLAADVLLEALREEPTYDATASHYVDALHVCEPRRGFAKYRRAIHGVQRRSEERTFVLSIATRHFRAARSGVSGALRLISGEPHPLARTLLIHRLFGDHPGAVYRTAGCLGLLRRLVRGADPDLARYAAGVLLATSKAGLRTKMRSLNRSVQLLMLELGLRVRRPRKTGALEEFFRKLGVHVVFPWRRALGSDWREAERRCIRLQRLFNGDPGAQLLMLDTFNELLIQNYSVANPALAAPYKKVAGRHAHPDYGGWLRHAAMPAALPSTQPWLLRVHDARVNADLAHAKGRTGHPTREVSYSLPGRLLRQGVAPWAHLLMAWQPFV